MPTPFPTPDQWRRMSRNLDGVTLQSVSDCIALMTASASGHKKLVDQATAAAMGDDPERIVRTLTIFARTFAENAATSSDTTLDEYLQERGQLFASMLMLLDLYSKMDDD